MDETNLDKRCSVCSGTGNIFIKADNYPGKEVIKKCHVCNGSGESRDRLTKVQPMPEMDLLK